MRRAIFVVPHHTSGVGIPTRRRFFDISIHIEMQSTLDSGDETYGYRRASLNTMTFVLAPLDYRRSTETVKTIVEHFQEAFGAGFQPLPKYGESGKDGTTPMSALKDRPKAFKKAFEAHKPPHTGR